MALAIRFDQLIQDGVVEDQGEIAPPRTQLIRRESLDFSGFFLPGMADSMRFASRSTGHASHRIRNSVYALLLTQAAVSRNSASG